MNVTSELARVEANGGEADSRNHDGAGGGGRIALYYELLSGFNVEVNASAYGGAPRYANYSAGSAGTIYLEEKSQSNVGELFIRNSSDFSFSKQGSTPVSGMIHSGPITINSAVVAFSEDQTNGQVINISNSVAGFASGIESNANININNSSIDFGQGFTANGAVNVSDSTVTFGEDSHYLGVVSISGVNDITYEDDVVFDLPIDRSAEIGEGSTVVLGQNVSAYNTPDLVVDGLSLSTANPLHFENIQVINGGEITVPHNSANPIALSITATNTLTIDETSSIDVTGKGGANVPSHTSVAGASHGGVGVGQSSESVYGDYRMPQDFGSGGVKSYLNTYGGGAIKITANILDLSGKVLANGSPYKYQVGGASGGSVWLDVNTLNITSDTSKIQANGGEADSRNHDGPGGGGRIALYYEFLNGLNLKENISAYGGASRYTNYSSGSAGTVYLEDKSQPGVGELFIRNSNAFDIAKQSYTPISGMVHSGPITIESAAVSFIEDQTNGQVINISNSVARFASGIESNANINIGGSTVVFGESSHYLGEITLSGANTVRFEDNVSSDKSININAETIVTYGENVDVHHSNDLVVDGYIMTVEGSLEYDNIQVINGGKITVDHDTESPSVLFINVAGTLTIDETSSIEVDNKGEGFVVGQGELSAGSHGGVGGNNTQNSVHGDYREPMNFGRGGKGRSSFSSVSVGGGAIKIMADTLELAGIISANSVTSGSGWVAPGGSGGSIWLDVNTLNITSGSAALTANGGDGFTGYSSDIQGGGGGRIAVYFQSQNVANVSEFISTYGGNKSYIDSRNGGAGTIYLENKAEPGVGELIVKNDSLFDLKKQAVTPIADLVHTGPLMVENANVVFTADQTNNQAISINDSLVEFVPNLVSSASINVSNSSVVFGSGSHYIGNVSLNGANNITFEDNVISESSIDPNEGDVIRHGENIDIYDGGNLMVDGYLLVASSSLNYDNIQVINGGKITVIHDASNPTALTINVANTLTIDETSSIDLTAKGGNPIAGLPAFVGGSHAGVGGGSSIDRVHGDYREPVDFGTGGYWSSSITTGGGALKIQADTLDLSGKILANGQQLDRASGGSGGSIWLDLNILNITSEVASIQANGGAAQGSAGYHEKPAGGGRIALYYELLNGFDMDQHVSAEGGDVVHSGSSFNYGGAGSIYLEDKAEPGVGELLLRNADGYLLSRQELTPVIELTHSGPVTVLNASVLISRGPESGQVITLNSSAAAFSNNLTSNALININTSTVDFGEGFISNEVVNLNNSSAVIGDNGQFNSGIIQTGESSLELGENVYIYVPPAADTLTTFDDGTTGPFHWYSKVEGKDSSKSDYTVSLSVRSTDNDGLGVMFRYIDENNFYRFIMSQQGSIRRIDKTVEGVTTILSEDTFAYSTHTQYEIKIEVENDTYIVSLDGNEVLSATDSDLTNGGVALLTHGNQSTYFDDLEIISSSGEVIYFQDYSSSVLPQFTIIDEGTSSGPSNWYVSGGELIQSSNIYTSGGWPAARGTHAIVNASMEYVEDEVFNIDGQYSNSMGDASGSGNKNSNVSSNSDGSYAVVWESDSMGYSSINLKVIDIDGDTLTSDMIVNTNTEGNRRNPDVHLSHDGKVYVVWEEDTDNDGEFQVAMRGFNNLGAEEMNEQLISDENSSQSAPAISGERYNIAIAWADDKVGNKNVYFKVYNSSDYFFSDEVQINDISSGVHSNPQVLVQANGHVVTTWAEDSDLNTYFEIRSRVFDVEGIEQIPAFKVNSISSGQQKSPILTGLDEGKFIVAFEDDSNGNGLFNVLASTYDSDGSPIVSDIHLNRDISGNFSNLSMTPLGDGKIVAFWNKNDSIIELRMFDTNLRALTNEINFNPPLNEPVLGDISEISEGVLAISSTGLNPDYMHQVGVDILEYSWDIDGDGVVDSLDVFPFDSTEWADINANELGDNSEGLLGWEVDNERHSGEAGYSIKSRATSAGQKSIFETIVNSSGGNLSFDLSTSNTEANSVKFYIDNVEQKTWLKNESSFISELFTLEPGRRAIKWEFVSDRLSSGISGSVWLDNIFIPAVPDSDGDGEIDAIEYKRNGSLDVDYSLN